MLGATYTVTLTVQDKAGNTASTSASATTVKPKAQAPTASFDNSTWAQSKTVTFSGLAGRNNTSNIWKYSRNNSIK